MNNSKLWINYPMILVMVVYILAPNLTLSDMMSLDNKDHATAVADSNQSDHDVEDPGLDDNLIPSWTIEILKFPEYKQNFYMVYSLFDLSFESKNHGPPFSQIKQCQL